MSSNASNLKLLIKLIETFGLIPRYNYGTNKLQKRKIYTFFLLALSGVLYGYLIYTKIERIESGASTVHLALIGLLEVCELFINILTVVAAVTWKFKDFCIFFETYDSFDQILLNLFKTQTPYIKCFNIHFGIVYLITLLEMFLDFFWTIQDKADTHEFVEFYLSHYMCLMIIAEYFFLVTIYNRFKVLNKILVILHTDGDMTTIITIKPVDEDLCSKINGVVRLHALACKLVDFYNELFGVQIFCVTFVHVVEVLISVHEMLDKGALLVTVRSSNWLLLGICQTVMVATMCEKVGKESKKIIAVSISLVNKYSNNKIAKQKLKILSQQANDRPAQFSAAGFFNVDFSMLFMFINLITTYVIVIIQFSNT